MQAQISQFLVWADVQMGWSRSTISGHKSHLGILLRWLTVHLGAEPGVTDVTADRCREWLVTRQRAGARPRTLYCAVNSVRAFGRYLHERGLLPDNPGMALRLPKLDDPVQKSCTEAQKSALMDAAQRRLSSPTDRAQATAILSTFLHAGLRRFELVALNVGDLQWSDEPRNSRLIVRAGKGYKRREIPINSALANHLQIWLKLRFGEDWRMASGALPLWLGVARRRMTNYMVGKVVEDIKTAAALGDSDTISPHAFRHYFATELDRAGVPLAEIQRLLGHERIETTLLYLQGHKEHLYDAVERLSRPVQPIDPRIQRALPTHRQAAFRRIPR